MRIAQSSLNLEAQASRYTRHQVEERFEFEFRAARPAPSASSTVQISDEARNSLAATQGTAATRADQEKKSATAMRLQILIDIVEQMTGRKVELFDAAELGGDPASATQASPDTSSGGAEWNLHFERHEIREKAEVAHFEARGTVKTADGREMNFSLELQMARFERHESSLTIDAGSPRRKDPLILNLNGGIATLTAERMRFDLDADGKADSISRLGSGSVFLALDRNGNDKIDDGSELFGPKTGNGFSELAQLDDDGNGWIDEADAAFSHLKVWDASGSLQSLMAAGVGAISLQNAATPFALREGADDRGEIQSTGVFLTEDGIPRSIQHVDLTV